MQLNLEQKKLILMEPSGHILIKGVAGSGKTTVAVHRIPRLMKRYCYDKDDQVLLVTFNKTLRNYIRYLYEKVENPDEQISMGELLNSEGKVDIKTIDSIVYSYYRKCCSDTNIKIATNNDKFSLMSKAIQLLAEKDQATKIINQKNASFLIDEVEWIDACLIETLEDYQQVDRIGRATNVMQKTPQKLLKNSEIRSSVFELKEIYQELMTRDKLTEFRMMNKLALTAPVKDSETYTHIIIDESQDLTKAQLEMVKRIYRPKPYSSITFIADNAQSIYSHSWLGKGRSYTTLGYDMSGKSRTLSKNYRTTTQIAEAAYSLQEKDETLKNDTDFVKPLLVDRKGHYPIYRNFAALKEELDHVKATIHELSSEYKLSEICVIAKEKRMAQELQHYLEQQKVPCEVLGRDNLNFESDLVKVSTMHSIKGLEFKVVLIICINEGVIPFTGGMSEDDNKLLESDERKLLYVGMTRANDLLYLSSHQKPSRFIQEIDTAFLRFRRNTCLKPLYLISITDYLKKDKILDVYAKEEMIRQWMLRELIDSYGYKEEMLEVEYPVMDFSRKGFADIVVSIYHQGKRVPYILVETKKYRAGIDDAEKQAASYMRLLETVRYCLITDGQSLKIMDRDLDEIEDLPRFNNLMLPDTLERYCYKSYRNQPDMVYERDSEDPGVISLKRWDSELAIPDVEVMDISVLGDVVAGNPLKVNEEIKEHFALPLSWMIQPKNTFMLEVVGDSMRDAGIDVGDYVIVNQQSTADNGQFVIALLDDEATLKRYMQMGDSVLLIPENSKYEPINLNPDQVQINGIVIGLLKRL